MPKKQNIYQKRDNLWEGRYTHDGKRKSLYGKTQTEVITKLKAVEADINNNEYIEKSKLKVGEWLQIWLNEYTADIKDSTRLEYQRIVDKRIIPVIGGKQLQKLRPDSVQSFYNSLYGEDCKKPLSPRSVEFTHAVLHKALSKAVALDYMKKNVCKDAILPTKIKKEVQILDDIPAFLTAVHGHKYEPLFLTLLYTGARVGEILGLSWNAVDFKTQTITLNQQLALARKKGESAKLTTLKNNKTRRLTPPREVFQILENHRREQLQAQLLAGQAWKNENNLVFTNPLGVHLDGCNLTRTFKKFLSDNKLKVVPLHSLRHTAATLMLQGGDSPKTVQKALGHHSAAFTLDVYGHVTETMERESANNFQRLIEAAKVM